MFITFEGPEGSGKTFQINALAQALRQRGFAVLTTREPGGTAIGDQVREILSNLENTTMRPRTETLLFQASRAQLVDEIIRPWLESGGVALCDRYADSTLAYQGYGHCIDLNELSALIRFATGGLQPDLTLLLDVDVEEGLRRKLSAQEWNRLDAYDLDFHRRVRRGFLEMARSQPKRWVVVDAGRPPDQVQAVLQQVVLERLKGTPA
jgi:dTMP kinase